MISRQLEPSMRIWFQVQSVHSPLPYCSMSGSVTSGGGRVALGGVVPDEELAVLLGADPRAGARERRNAAGVGNVGALAGAVPAPVVERARDVVALDLSLRQVAAHVAAVGVEDLEVAVGVGPDYELRAERVDGVGLAVPERLAQAEAVPASRVPRPGFSDVDLANRCHVPSLPFGFLLEHVIEVPGGIRK